MVEYAKEDTWQCLRVNSKVMRCSRYVNRGRMHERLNGEQLEEVDCFKYLGRKWHRIKDVRGYVT